VYTFFGPLCILAFSPRKILFVLLDTLRSEGSVFP